MDPAQIEEILKNDPALQKYHAEQFIRAHQEEYLKVYDTTGAELPTAAALTAEYYTERPSLPVTDVENSGAIHRAYATYEQGGIPEGTGADLAEKHPITDTVRTRVKHTLHDAHAAWQKGVQNKHTGEEKEAQYQEKQDKTQREQVERETAQLHGQLRAAADHPFTLTPAAQPVAPPPVKPDHSGT